MKTFICLGSEAEVVGILPIVQREFEATGVEPGLVVSNACLTFALGVPFVAPVPFSLGLKEALKWVKERSGTADEVIAFPSSDDKEFPTEHRQASYQFDQWDRADCLHLWNKLPLTLPRSESSVASVKGFKPFILLADDDPDHPFQFKYELHALLIEKFPLHQIVRLPKISLTHLFDALALYDAADLIVCAETVHLQLSRACKTPVIALLNDQPTAWHGSAPASRFAFSAQYGKFPHVKDALIAAAKEARAPSVATSDWPSSAEGKPSVTLVYIYVPGDAEFEQAAKRFVASYLKFPPGIAHHTMIVCQEHLPDDETIELLEKLPNVLFYVHNNAGWDIGGFITASRIISADIMVCFGSSAYFKRAGWLARMVDVWEKHGPGFYGSLATYEINPHINTSGFWCAPKLLSEYPFKVQTKVKRYDFEHGKNALWRLCLKDGIKVMLATWDGEYEWSHWRQPPNIYRRGDQSNCLTFFHHNEKFDLASPETREKMSKLADMLMPLALPAEAKPQAQAPVMNPPKVVVVYVYPTVGGKHDEMAARFVDTYKKFPADEPHELWVVSNGGEPTPQMRQTFAGILCNLLPNPNSLADGLDISAYRKAAREIPCELMVFFGGNTYLVRRGWLKRMVEAYQKHGMALYGATGSLGHNIHIRTTGFWMPPSLLNAYPYPVTSETASRYEFEHGKKGLTGWVMARGLKAFMVTWTGEFEWRQWDGIPNGFQRGDQSALLVGDRLTQPEYQRQPGPRQAIQSPTRQAVQPPPRPAPPTRPRLAITKKR